MARQQLGLERIGMIEVDPVPLFSRESVEIAVVRIVRNPVDPIFPDAIVNGAGDGRLARAGTAGNSDDDRLQGESSSSSDSVMNSLTSSLPHVVQTACRHFP